MRRRLAILAMAAAALVAISPGPASAEGVPAPQPAGSQVLNHLESALPPAKTFRSGFRLEARGGDEVEVTTTGNAVFLVVKKGQFAKRIASTVYLARGVARPERLQATFGGLGSVSMRFREARNKTWAGKPRNCRGAQRFVKRRGVFVGSLRFRGEDGYVSVRAHRARGSVITLAPKCLRQRRPGLPGVRASSHQAVFAALARDGVDFTRFIAVEGRRTVFLAMHEEVRGKLAIVRLAVARNRRDPFQVNEALTRARVSAPAPFHGTGRYSAAPDGTVTWSGDLSVNFPGAPRFPLTGAGFETFLEVPF